MQNMGPDTVGRNDEIFFFVAYLIHICIIFCEATVKRQKPPVKNC